MNIPYIMKKCSKCGEWKVASSINFRKSKGYKYNLRGECRECAKKYKKQWYEANKEKVAEYDKQYRENNKEKIAEQRKQYREANKEKVAEQKKRYYQDNRERELERQKQYYQDNKDKIAEYHKQYREANKEKIAEQRKQWYEANKDKILERNKRYYETNKKKIAEWGKQYREANKDKKLEYNKQWRQTPAGQVSKFNEHQRRRLKEEQQGKGITKDQWLECMSFFNWDCAYSGERLTKNTRSIDHIVPIDVGGDHMIWNCVPMLRKLNSSKQDKDMLEWYREQSFYDPNRLQKIYAWQEYAYNKYGKNSEYFNSGNIQIKLI